MVGSDKAIVLDGCMSVEIFPSDVLTDIDEAAGGALAELPGLVREADLDYPRDVPGRGLHPDGVVGDELAPHRDRPEDHLEPVEEILSNDDDSLAPGSPAFRRG